jgi:hypothetical protein
METWLIQRRPDNGMPLLRDFPIELVRVTCHRCMLARQFQLTSLIDTYGPAAGLPDVLATLSADCLRHRAIQTSDLCAARFPDFEG